MMSIHDCKSMNKVSVSIQETTYELSGVKYSNHYALKYGSVVSRKVVPIPKSHQSIFPKSILHDYLQRRVL